MTYYPDVGARIKKLAESRNMSAAKLGKIIGRERKCVYRLYEGYLEINTFCIVKLCLYFKVSADYILFGKELKR